MTALCSSQIADPEALRFLLDSGVPCNRLGEYGTTPLHAACAQGHTSLVSVLLEAGADVNAIDDEDEGYPQTPIDKAALSSRTAGDPYIHVIELLFLYGSKWRWDTELWPDFNIEEVPGLREVLEKYASKGELKRLAR